MNSSDARASCQHSLVGLDILRGLAAFAVFVGHVRDHSFVAFSDLPGAQQTHSVRALFVATHFGREAVLLFFALSGFLVFGQVVRRLDSKRFDLSDYVIDRTSRIFLPLIPAVLLSAFLGAMFRGREASTTQIVLNFIGLNGVLTDTLGMNAPLWTLSYEIWFYVFAGALGTILAQPRRPLAGFLVIAATLFVFTQLQSHYLGCWLAAGLVVFLLGTKRPTVLAVGGIILPIAGSVLVQIGTENKAFASVHLVPVASSETMVVLGVALTMPFFSLPKVNIALARIRPFATAISAISFSLYLFHYPLNTALDVVFPKATEITATAWLNFGLRLLICLSGSVLCYAAFERNTDAVRQRLRKAFKGKPIRTAVEVT